MTGSIDIIVAYPNEAYPINLKKWNFVSLVQDEA